MTPLSFWERSGLQDEDRDTCIAVLQETFRGSRVEEFEEQGYCSYTLLIIPLEYISTMIYSDENGDMRKLQADTFIVQLRTASHALDLDLSQAASIVYLSLAPKIRPLPLALPGTLCAYEMGRLDGTPFSRIQPGERALDADMRAKSERLVESFTSIVAQSWVSSSRPHALARHARADSPMAEDDMLSQCTGKVGSSILQRLQNIAAKLPDVFLREKAKEILSAVRNIVDYPVVLNHGDLIPSNILVDKETWQITGLVDWAEAEYLPFGTCLYGLEHLLGFFTPASSDDDVLTFTYFDHAPQLRAMFWERLVEAQPGIKGREYDVRAMRDMGVLLWHGIAWDDGAINRVVNEEDDAEELVRLRAFLKAY